MRKENLLLIALIYLQFTIHIFFLGQLSPFPFLWGLLLITICALSISLGEWLKDRNFHSWFWGLLVIGITLKFFFYPQFPFFSTEWLHSLGAGFISLSNLGWQAFSSARLTTFLSSDIDATAGVFLFLALLFWLVSSIGLKRALNKYAGGWLFAFSLLILVWMEPTFSFAFFFPLEVLANAFFFLLLIYLGKKESLRFSRFAYRKEDLRRFLIWSLLFAIPLLILLIPWSGGLINYHLQLPALPSFPKTTQVPGISIPSSSLPSSGGFSFPFLDFPPLDLPHWLDILAYVNSYIVITLFFLVLAFLYGRFGGKESLIYLFVFLLLFGLSLWLLPPILGPFMTEALYYLKQGINYLLSALGLNPSAAGLKGSLPSGSLPFSDILEDLIMFFRPILSFFSQAGVLIITGVSLSLIVFFLFFLRSLKRKKGYVSYATRGEGKVPHSLESGGSCYFYFRLLAELSGHGLRREESETPTEFSLRAFSSYPQLVRELGEVTEAFIQARYAHRILDPPTIQHLESLVDNLAQAIQVTGQST